MCPAAVLRLSCGWLLADRGCCGLLVARGCCTRGNFGPSRVSNFRSRYRGPDNAHTIGPDMVPDMVADMQVGYWLMASLMYVIILSSIMVIISVCIHLMHCTN